VIIDKLYEVGDSFRLKTYVDKLIKLFG